MTPASLSWVEALLRARSSIPPEALRATAMAYCRSLGRGTVDTYLRHVSACEAAVGLPFRDWGFPLSEDFLRTLVSQLML